MTQQITRPVPEHASHPVSHLPARAAPLPRATPAHVEPCRTAVLTRDELVRRGLLDVLGTYPEIELVPGDQRPESLRRLAEGSQVDLVVLDLPSAEDGSAGIAEVRAVKLANPGLTVVLLARELQDDDVLSAVSGGVDALVSRSSPVEDLLAVMRQVIAGEPALDRHFCSAVVRALRREHTVHGASLTAREREVLSLVALGQRNSVVARTLFISESTVKFHLRNITDKLGATNRAEVVSIALRLGLG